MNKGEALSEVIKQAGWLGNLFGNKQERITEPSYFSSPFPAIAKQQKKGNPATKAHWTQEVNNLYYDSLANILPNFGQPDSGQVNEETIKIIANQLGLNPAEINAKKTLQDYNADSLDNIETLMELEAHYGIDINDDAWLKLKTIADIQNYVTGRQKDWGSPAVKQASAGYKLARLIKLSSLANKPYKVKTKVKPTHKGIQQPQQIGIAAQPQTQNPNQVQSIEQSSQSVQAQQGQQANNYSGVAPLIVNPMMASLGVKKANNLGELLSSVDNRETLAKLLERIWRLKQVTKLFKAIKYR